MRPALASLLVALFGCDAHVDAGAGGAGGTSAVDQACVDACIAKGESVDVCTDACAENHTKTSASSGTTTGANTTGTTSGGDKLDAAIEKACVSCWYDEAESSGACATQATACEKSLACAELQWCPASCGWPDCFDECNDVIPSGVALLQALVQCSACNGGPCADACTDSVMLGYCE